LDWFEIVTEPWKKGKSGWERGFFWNLVERISVYEIYKIYERPVENNSIAAV